MSFKVLQIVLKAMRDMGWKDGSQVKSTRCLCRGPTFCYQYPHGGS